MLSLDFLMLVGGLGLAATSVYLFTSSVLYNNADAEMLAWASEDAPAKSKSPFIEFSRPLVHNFTLQHALRLKVPNYRLRVKKKILTGGLAREINVDEFIGLQLLWGLMAPMFLIVMNFALQLNYPISFLALMTLIGAYFPHFYATSQKKIRYTSVTIDLPFFIDLMALSTEAGLDFIGAIQRIVDKAQDSVLAEELDNVLRDIKLGSSRAEALRGLSERLDIQEVTSFCSVVIDADQTL
jgi:tight adherence protein C